MAEAGTQDGAQLEATSGDLARPDARLIVKPNWANALMGLMFVGICLVGAKRLLDPHTEWRFDGISWLVIPTVLIQAAWWITLAYGVLQLAVAAMPGMPIIFGRDKMKFPNLLTRRYKAYRYDDIVQVAPYQHGLMISTDDGAIGLRRKGMSARDWERLGDELVARLSPEALEVAE